MEQTIKVGHISVATIIFKLIIDFILCAFIVGIFLLIRDLITFITTKLVITDKRITGKKGLIHTNHLDCPLNRLDGVQVKQGLFGKIFNYGTISISTGSTLISFPYISHPNDFRATLNEQIDKFYDTKLEKQAQTLAAAMNK